jgi:hypothetical protein
LVTAWIVVGATLSVSVNPVAPLPPVGASPQKNPPLGVFVEYNTFPFAAG